MTEPSTKEEEDTKQTKETKDEWIQLFQPADIQRIKDSAIPNRSAFSIVDIGYCMSRSEAIYRFDQTYRYLIRYTSILDDDDVPEVVKPTTTKSIKFYCDHIIDQEPNGIKDLRFDTGDVFVSCPSVDGLYVKNRGVLHVEITPQTTLMTRLRAEQIYFYVVGCPHLHHCNTSKSFEKYVTVLPHGMGLEWNPK